ncbi:MAG: MarC family protein [Pseudomonadota bacterium]
MSITIDVAINAFVTLFVTIDPPGQAAIFLALTAGMVRRERSQVALLAVLTATGILAMFMFAGAAILNALGVSLAAFRVAGGLLLFYTAFEMVFEKRQQRHKKSAKRAITIDDIKNVAIFPLAVPLIAGPGAISATILLSAQFSSLTEKLALFAIIASVCLIVYLVLILSEFIERVIGDTGRNILTRLLGILLAALSVQFVADGILALAAG